MSTHFVCQATEPLPHKFPTSRKAEKGHGAVSQYEVLNISNKRHTQFPPPGWDTSQSSEDSLPFCQSQVPAWKVQVPTLLTGPDPDLCLTPEKGLSNRNISDISLLSQPPAPTQEKQHHLIGPDPQLAVTPEKQFINNQEYKSNLKQDCDINFKSKKSHRVRFNVEDKKSRQSDVISQSDGKYDAGQYSLSSKTYKPFSYCNQEDFSTEENDDDFKFPDNKQIYSFNTQNDDVGVKKPFAFSMKDDGKDSGIELCDRTTFNEDQGQYVPILPEVIPDSTPELDISPDLSTVKVKSGKTSNTIVKTDLSSATNPKSKSGKNSKRKVRITRESKKGQLDKDYEFPFDEPGESVLEYEHVFARPEYNSTLRLRSEIESIKKCSVDMSKALEKKLQISDTKTNINEKAAAHVNTDTQFTGLVSLEVPLEDLCATAEKETEEKWRYLKPSHTKYKVSRSKDAKEPDLLEFFTPDCQRETLELSVPSPATPFESLATANHMSAFDLYRHNRVWDGSSNFRIGK